MPSTPATMPVIDHIPEPRLIRERLSELAAERNLLRGLLKLWEERECGKQVLRRRRQGQEVARG